MYPDFFAKKQVIFRQNRSFEAPDYAYPAVTGRSGVSIMQWEESRLVVVVDDDDDDDDDDDGDIFACVYIYTPTYLNIYIYIYIYM